MRQLDYESPQQRPDSKLTIGFVICCATGALAGGYSSLWLMFYGYPPRDVLATTPCFAAPGLVIAMAITVVLLRLLRLPAWGRIVLVTIAGFAVTFITTALLGLSMYISRMP